MKKVIIYIHGKDGSPTEAERYRAVCPGFDVIGLDYVSDNPWDAAEEFPRLFDEIAKKYSSVTVIANSIGAYFSLCALGDKKIDRALFVSPVVDMERLITDMMSWAGVSEEKLKEEKLIPTPFGISLSWEYLSYIRSHPFTWRIPTDILYGGRDELIARDTILSFAEKHGASLSIMESGVHWFHTDEQLSFLDKWVRAHI